MSHPDPGVPRGGRAGSPAGVQRIRQRLVSSIAAGHGSSGLTRRPATAWWPRVQNYNGEHRAGGPSRSDLRALLDRSGDEEDGLLANAGWWSVVASRRDPTRFSVDAASPLPGSVVRSLPSIRAWIGSAARSGWVSLRLFSLSCR